jgi:hypothetical protein
VPGAGVEAPAIDEKPTAKATNPDRQRTKRAKAIPGRRGPYVSHMNLHSPQGRRPLPHLRSP